MVNEHPAVYIPIAFPLSHDLEWCNLVEEEIKWLPKNAI